MTDLIDVDAYLAEQKDYQGLLGFTKKNRMAHAAVIVASERAQSSIGVTAAIQAAVSEIILETIILMSVIVTSSSHSSSSSSSH